MARNGPTDPADGQRTVEVIGQLDYSGPAAFTELKSTPRYRGITVCGRGWVCPVCASKITERRRRELRRGVGRWRDKGGSVLLLTLTYSHGPQDQIRDQWKQLGRAYSKFAQSETVKRFRRAVGWAGRVRSREVTWGINGWHPHIHTLELIGAELTDDELAYWKDALSREWQRWAERCGLGRPTLEHGCTLSRTDVDDYIAKWGLDAELTKWHVKRGRVDPEAPAEAGLHGYSPFDLLRVASGELVADERLNLSKQRAGALFADYAAAVHGTAQLHWTRGLKLKLELCELIGKAELMPAEAPLLQGDRNAPLEVDSPTDAEIAEGRELKADETVLGTLRASDWYVIAATNKQLEFLALVAAGGFKWARVFVSHWRDELEEWRAKRAERQRKMRGLAYLWRGS